ncbi:type II secretion system F family protein [Geomonas sp. RF6]|uniref:type II secretion system F family protein n=1 Tax=Geomonas sp. RF6 TaxID=2897342 RepID=UPI001E402CB1|nr:type II secretion system F family protein [Geomonas sp. RF6]UFS70008.1 type II secretion system F family protein [Geomonas sp. RF6]
MTVIVIMTFAAVVVATFAVFFGWRVVSNSMMVKRRLRQVSDPAGAHFEPVDTTLLRERSAADQILERAPLTRGIIRELNFSGVKLTPLQLVLINCALPAFFFVVILAWKGAFPAVLAAVLSGFLPYAYLRNRKEKRRSLLDEQLPDALTMVARSLRAGQSLSTAVELVGEELPDPAGGLFKMAHEQERFGIRISESLRLLRARIESVDYNFFVTIVRINSESGGNLAEILEKLAETIRVRQQIRRQVKVYTAEGSMSGYVLAGLPVLLFCVFSVTRPEYMQVFYTDKLCKLILGVTVLAQIVGFVIIRRIVDIRI